MNNKEVTEESPFLQKVLPKALLYLFIIIILVIGLAGTYDSLDTESNPGFIYQRF